MLVRERVKQNREIPNGRTDSPLPCTFPHSFVTAVGIGAALLDLANNTTPVPTLRGAVPIRRLPLKPTVRR